MLFLLSVFWLAKFMCSLSIFKQSNSETSDCCGGVEIFVLVCVLHFSFIDGFFG